MREAQRHAEHWRVAWTPARRVRRESPVMLKDDSLTLRQAGIQDGTKLMLVGSKVSDVLAVTSAKPAALTATSSKLADSTVRAPGHIAVEAALTEGRSHGGRAGAGTEQWRRYSCHSLSSRYGRRPSPLAGEHVA